MEGVGPAKGREVIVGRVHEVLEYIFGEELGPGLGRGRILAVEGVSPGCPRCMLIQKILGLTVVVIRGGDGWRGLEFWMSLLSSR